MTTLTLRFASNIFMTVAWYGHLRFKDVPLWKVIVVSWLIAAIEDCLQVPANRWGHGQFTAAQLKISQEVITILVFLGWLYLGETPRWNESLALGLVLAAVVVATLPAR